MFFQTEQKMFNRQNWNVLMKIMKNMGMDWNDKRFIKILQVKNITAKEDEEIEGCGLGQE